MEVLAACPRTARCGRCTLGSAACPSKRAPAGGHREIAACPRGDAPTPVRCGSTACPRRCAPAGGRREIAATADQRALPRMRRARTTSGPPADADARSRRMDGTALIAATRCSELRELRNNKRLNRLNSHGPQTLASALRCLRRFELETHPNLSRRCRAIHGGSRRCIAISLRYRDQKFGW